MANDIVRRLVVSAVNFTEGGPLSALRDCLSIAASSLSDKWEIIALVHDQSLFDIPRITFIEFPHSKRSWLSRLYYEFWKFDALSRELNPDVWFSLHDISPRVNARRRVVYCHNPSPFYQPPIREVLWDPKFFLFTLLYRYIYRINIHSNNFVIVQQDWIRNAFQHMYGISNIVVAHPIIRDLPIFTPVITAKNNVFFYPALPRVFKNFEVICDAAEILCKRIGNTFEVRLTISGSESRYAAYLKRRYEGSPVIRFIGLQSKEQMMAQYQEASALVFPSKIETWGLPISEAKGWRKPLLMADLPYAHETVGTYAHVNYFDPQNASQLAGLMEAHLNGTLHPQAQKSGSITEPFAANWEELIRFVVAEPADSTEVGKS